MTATLVGLGAIVEAGSWWLVVASGLRAWVSLGVGLGALGALALVAGPVALSPGLAPGAAAAIGLGAGVALYIATRAFVSVVRPWRAFRRHALAIYGLRQELPMWAVLVLAVGVTAAGEELFWRGLAQARLSAALGRAGGTTLGWLAFVASNVPSMNLAIILGAVVGGGVWAALALGTRGVLASLLCHGVWTALMIAFPAVTPGEAS